MYKRQIANKTIRQRPIINVILFVLTLATTYFAGLMFGGVLKAIIFSLSIIIILGGHELGHYFVCKYYNIPATLPYFIPAPFTLIGTFGAVIRMGGLIPSRKEVIEVGIAGPIVSFLLSIPAAFIGLHYSTIVPASSTQGIKLGDSLIFLLLTYLVKGETSPGTEIMLHPLALSAWIGFFVTALNLLPLGQLDGGHILYGFLTRNRKYVVYPVAGILFLLGFLWQGWWFWLFLILLLGFKHPPLVDEISPLIKRDKFLLIFALLMFILSFVPVPFQLIFY